MGLRKTSQPEPLREVVDRRAPRDMAGLIGQLRSADAGERRWAARDLAGFPEAAAALGEHLLSEHDVSVREALLTSLSKIADEGAASALLPLLRSEDAQLRNGAIEALASMPSVIGPRIGRLLRDPDPDVRIFTVNLLGDLRHPQVTDWLVQVLASDDSVNVVAAAIEVLAEVGSPTHVAALRGARLKFDHDPFIGFAVDIAIDRVEAA